MERVILLRFSEIFLKGNNRKFFEKKLIDNIKETLKSYEYRFSTSQNRYVVSAYDVDFETEIVERLKKVFGIYSLSVANKVKTDFGEIRKAAVDLFDDTPLKFRVTVRRADKRVEIPSPVMAGKSAATFWKNIPKRRLISQTLTRKFTSIYAKTDILISSLTKSTAPAACP